MFGSPCSVRFCFCLNFCFVSFNTLILNFFVSILLFHSFHIDNFVSFRSLFRCFVSLNVSFYELFCFPYLIFNYFFFVSLHCFFVLLFFFNNYFAFFLLFHCFILLLPFLCFVSLLILLCFLVYFTCSLYFVFFVFFPYTYRLQVILKLLKSI